MFNENSFYIPSTYRKKVVSIPVHFVDDSRNSRYESALKIQKAFRGFRVRRTVAKILEVSRDVESVARKLAERETVEKIVKSDGKERLRLNELLMALLLKLDAVRCVDGGVRVLRKSVIGKAIALQEMIDRFAVSGGEIGDVRVRTGYSGEIDKIHYDDVRNECGLRRVDVEIDECDEKVVRTENFGEKIEKIDDDDRVSDDDARNECGLRSVVEIDDCEDRVVDRIGDEIMDVEGGEMEKASVTEGWECVREEREEGTSGASREGEEWCVVDKRERSSSKEVELMERIVEDNKKLMEMVADLRKRSLEEASLISALSKRVEQLEKVIVNERSKVKKMKKGKTKGL